jgi:hypothetical protein
MGRTHCDATASRCVACLTNADCTNGQTCSDGACSGCGTGQTDCGGGNCVDTQTNARNCGQCGRACGATEVCNAGTCGCRTGLTSCSLGGGAGAFGTTCVDTKSDPLDCGGCGDLQTQTNVCAAGQQCQGGACQPATTGCSAPTPDACQVGGRGGGAGGRVACVDRQTDPLNCGACGNACPGNQSCVNGRCTGG